MPRRFLSVISELKRGLQHGTIMLPMGDEIPERIQELIKDYDKRADHHMKFYENLKLLEIICGFAIPTCSLVLSGNPARIAAGILGSFIAAIESYLQFRQYERHWQRWRSAAWALKQEKWLFLQKAGPYKDFADPKSAAILLAERVEEIASNEHKLWIELQVKKPERDSSSLKS